MSELMEFDLSRVSVRELNRYLHADLPGSRVDRVRISNPNGLHSLAVGLDCEVEIEIAGHAGYFIAGMNKLAKVTVEGNVGWSVGENMMSGEVIVRGHASESAGASARGGLLVIDGDASSRCGISLKGGRVVVAGDVGHFSAFMAQAGTMVVCGNAGANLGDSLYEAVLYVGGAIDSLGADAREEPLEASDVELLKGLLGEAGVEANAENFRRVASSRSLYHWNSEAHQEY
jgi:glutamate synthase domain-containing protein 3